MFNDLEIERFDDNDDTMNASSEFDTMNSSSEFMASFAEAAELYGYEETRAVTTADGGKFQRDSNSFPEGPGSPLPADRLARKQRHFGRRGGACHSALLQSAVMACMSSPKEDDDKPAGFSSLDMITSSSSGEQETGTSTSSPRKRLRRTDRPKRVTDESMIAGASVLLASLSMAPLDSGSTSTRGSSMMTSNHNERNSDDFKRQPPVRRVSRRKSYTSVASGASDYDEEEFADLLDD